MKNTGSAYITKTMKICLSCLGELVILMPLYVAGAVFVVPQYLSFAWIALLPLVSFLGVAVRHYVPVLWKKLAAAILIGAGCTAIVIASGLTGWLQLVGVVAVLFALQGMTAAERAGEAKLYWYGVALYFVAGIVFSRVDILRAQLPLITWLGIGCLALALFITNYDYLRYSTLSDASSPLPKGMRRHNTIFIVIILGLVILLAAGAGRWIGSRLLSIVKYIFAWFMRPSKEPVAPQPEEAAPLPMLFPGEVQEPGLLAHILNVIFYIIGGALVAVLLGLVLYWLYKNAGGVWRRGIERLLALLRRRDHGEGNVAYHDEETSIFSWEETRQKWSHWRKAFNRLSRRQERYEDMTSNQERVRYLYRRLISAGREEGYPFKPGLTPRETVHNMQQYDEEQDKQARGRKSVNSGRITRRTAMEPFIAIYYRVRYGEQEPEDEEVAEIKRKLNL